MDQLITIMNKLQDVIIAAGGIQTINLPQIVVVGAQSSGKSSVLENLVGKSFLPRGTGIVTRVPLVLHLLKASDEDFNNAGLNQSNDWAIFSHKPGVVFTDFNKVKKEIEAQTDKLAGDKKNISDSQIVLNIYSYKLYNLSFVDLPGLTKVPVGDQPEDIEIKIKNLVLKFIENPNSIILAVVTANTDPATSESLHIAKNVDPNGDRTIAVVTKIDIMDAGTDATELLSGEVIPVKLGIIGVINRSQKAITEQKSLDESLAAENEYFQTKYPAISQKHGTVLLGKTLQQLLIKKIQDTCPTLKNQLYAMNSKFNEQVKLYKAFTDNYDKSLLDILTQTATSYRACLDGQVNDMCLTELQGGASIARYFKNTFQKEIDDIDPLSGLSHSAIVNAIRNALGTSIGVFMPTQAFDHLIKRQIKLMEGPSLACVNFVYEELIGILYKMEEDINRELKKYPRLLSKVTEVLQEMLVKYKEKSVEAVCKIIRYQEAYVNTGHPDFITEVIESEEYQELFENSKITEEYLQDSFTQQSYSTSTLNSKVERKPTLKELAREMRYKVEKISSCGFTGFSDTDKPISESRVNLLTLFLKCYYKVVKKIIQDTVPKAIMHEMVNSVKRDFQKMLISKIYKCKSLKMEELLYESDEIADERIKTLRRLEATEKALKLMRDIEQLCHNFST
ncbi:LOW QUALITY PROTEIN: dynamin-1-like protein [Adelges cooleyi]|uniref:LOW QUALITY PROTEIN: dynamin-1-like protein n=1 Tax=Adelges cooleyi TaxID=133065 RepID=UPI0021801328|nr:LOW QUALITY PROTEIN: dynamin-1-like protein [Adelges cooleyi]